MGEFFTGRSTTTTDLLVICQSGGLRMKQVTHVTRFCFVFLIPKDQKNQCRYKMIGAFWPLESLKPTVLLSILKLRLWFILGNSAKNSSSAKSCFQKWFFFYMFTFPVRVECWIALKARLRSSTLQPENECKCWDFRVFFFFLVGEGLVLVEGVEAVMSSSVLEALSVPGTNHSEPELRCQSQLRLGLLGGVSAQGDPVE